MAELIEPVDAEAIVIAHARSRLAAQVGFVDVGVGDRLPAATDSYSPPAEFVVVRRTGGTTRDLVVDIAQVTLTSWAATPEDAERASQIARRLHAVITAAEREGFMADVPCYSVQALSVPYFDPDPVTARARYSATYQIALRSTVL